MKVVYTKVDASSVEVITLAKAMNESPSVVATLVNQQRYRAAYNKLQQARMKAVRTFMREHPEALSPGKGGK